MFARWARADGGVRLVTRPAHRFAESAGSFEQAPEGRISVMVGFAFAAAILALAASSWIETPRWIEEAMIVGTLVFVVAVVWVLRRFEVRNRDRAAAACETEKRCRMVVDETPVLLCSYLPNREIAFANRAYGRLVGRDPDSLIGESFLGMIPEQDRAKVLDEISTLTAEQPTRTHEHRVLAAGGRIVWIRWTNHALFDNDRSFLSCVSFGEDVTERKRIEFARGVDRKANVALMRAVPLGVGVTVNRVIQEVNDRFCQMTGFDRSQLIGQSARVLYPSQEEYERVGRMKYEQIDRAGVGRVETTMQRPDGTRLEVLLSSAPHDPGDLSKGVTFTALDITERRQKEDQIRAFNEELEDRVADRTAELEQRIAEVERLNRGILNLADDLQLANARLEQLTRDLKESNRDLEAFAYSVSHDLRAPLRHISGFVSLLWDSSATVLDEGGRRHLQLIADSATRMAKMIDELLEFSRAGRVDLKVMPVNMNRLASEVIGEFATGTHERKIEWVVGDLPEIQADRTALKQVVANLIDNAVKYTRRTQHPRIELGVAPSNGAEVVFFVRDNGAGFDPRYSGKLFGVFQRLHSSEEFEGTGIGLANVRRLVNRHGGQTWAEGKLGEGAVFFFTLAGVDRDGLRHGGSGVASVLSTADRSTLRSDGVGS